MAWQTGKSYKGDERDPQNQCKRKRVELAKFKCKDLRMVNDTLSGKWTTRPVVNMKMNSFSDTTKFPPNLK